MMIYQAKLIRNGGSGGFGFGVSLSADGVDALISGGSSAVFSRRFGGWSQDFLLPGGNTVALTSNGDMAFLQSGDGVDVYRRVGGTWVGQYTLVGTDATAQSIFGRAIVVSPNRKTVLIAGPYHNNSHGAVWPFVRDPMSHDWLEEPKLTPPGVGGYYGWSVALSGDGSTALIGAPRADQEKGAVYTYTRDERYLFVSKMGSPDRSDTWFGRSVALSRDGGTALIGDNTGVRAFVRRPSPPGWQPDGDKLTAIGGLAALSADGTIALIGDHTADRAWLWLRAGALYELIAPDKIGFAYYGLSVALAPDGNTALIGGMADNNGMGAAWLFIAPLGVSGVNPTSGPATGGTAVTISGNGFNGAARVRFGATPAASFTVDGATQITAVSPPGQPGIVNVTVTTSVGTSEAILASQFTFV